MAKAQIELEARRTAIEARLAEDELDFRRDQLHAVQEAHRREIDLKRERLERECELVRETIALIKHAFDRRMDFYVMSFEKTAGLVERERERLGKELSEMERASLDPSLNSLQRLALRESKTRIEIERRELLGLYQRMRVELEHSVFCMHLSIARSKDPTASS